MMPGAPENPQIRKKIIITTSITTLLWLVVFALVQLDVFSFRDFAAQLPLPPR